jgi:glutaredoxin 3
MPAYQAGVTCPLILHYLKRHIFEREQDVEGRMARITMFTTPYCPYCQMAKALLKRKGVTFDEIDVSRQPDLRAEMTRRAGGRTSVPQIWIGDRHIGGCDDLYELDEAGGLDPLLADAS